MSTLNSLLLDRRLWLAGLTTVLGLVLGLWTFSPSAALKLVSHLGYWVVLGVFVMFVWAVQRVVGRVFADWRPSSYRLRVAAFIGIAGCILLAHEKYGFKILADEALLLGTSMGIHHVREVAYPLRATDVQGPFQILDRRVDKRPFFYPFLVSLVHDFTGYRTTNGFYLNTVLGFLFLGLVYALARRVSGMEWGGVFAVLLFAGLPLLSQQMKGGGFELLNLVMLTTTALLSIHFAEKRDEIALNALVMSAVLLGLTRYESILVLVPVALLIVWGWWIERRVVLTWPAIFSPLILSVYLLQNRIFTVQESSWELASRPEATTPFGLHYLGDNLAHAVAFFFDTSGYQPNSPFFAAIGLCALPFLVLWLTRLLLRLRNAEPEQVGIALSAVGLIGIAGLLMVYFWWQFDHPVIHRLSLPVHLLMVLAIAVTGRQLFRRSRGWQVLCGGAILALVAYSLPAMRTPIRLP
jgi:hypothetical protein